MTKAQAVEGNHDVDLGCILVDGVDVRDMTQAKLRSRIGLVPQKASLFSGSIDEMKDGYDSAIVQEAPIYREGRSGGSRSPGPSCAGGRSTFSMTASRPSISRPKPG